MWRNTHRAASTECVSECQLGTLVRCHHRRVGAPDRLRRPGSEQVGIILLSGAITIGLRTVSSRSAHSHVSGPYPGKRETSRLRNRSFGRQSRESRPCRSRITS
jgi:hypothetical protein